MQIMNNLNLDIPLIKQREGSFHCQVATALMILEFFNDPMSYDELLEALQPYILEDGMHSQGTMLFFAKRGYKTLFAHHDLGVMHPDIENRTEKNLDDFETHFSSLEKTEQNTYRIEKLALDIEYMKSGGSYSTKLPTLELVDEYLEKEIPVTIGVRNKGLHLNPIARNANHSITITGKEGDEYLINDPSPKTEGKYKISRDRLLHAWYNSGVQLKVIWK